MPEGDAIHRIANTFSSLFEGAQVQASSPQGRFASSAQLIDGHVVVAVRAVGKHMFVAFAAPGLATSVIEQAREIEAEYAAHLNSAEAVAALPFTGSSPVWGERAFPCEESLQWLHIHLGLYGSWRFDADERTQDVPASIGAPRTNWVATKGHRHAALKWASYSEDSLYVEDNLAAGEAQDPAGQWQAPEPVGQVRLRILSEVAVADVTGPNRCELISDEQRLVTESKLGCDPLQPGASQDPAMRKRFIELVRARKRPVGELIMDQSIAAGVGNIYRAEALFLAGISPMRAGNRLSKARVGQLWDIICELMTRGLEIGRIDTIRPEDQPDPIPEGDEELGRWYIYHRSGRPCIKCGTMISEKLMQNRRLFWCSNCQN